MPVHLYGQCADMKAIRKIADRHKLFVIGDNAQGIGAQMDVNGAQAGLAKAADGRMAALHDWNDARVDLLQALGTIRTLAQ